MFFWLGPLYPKNKARITALLKVRFFYAFSFTSTYFEVHLAFNNT